MVLSMLGFDDTGGHYGEEENDEKVDLVVVTLQDCERFPSVRFFGCELGLVIIGWRKEWMGGDRGF